MLSMHPTLFKHAGLFAKPVGHEDSGAGLVTDKRIINYCSKNMVGFVIIGFERL
jgi:hypothetical protein